MNIFIDWYVENQVIWIEIDGDPDIKNIMNLHRNLLDNYLNVEYPHPVHVVMEIRKMSYVDIKLQDMLQFIDQYEDYFNRLGYFLVITDNNLIRFLGATLSRHIKLHTYYTLSEAVEMLLKGDPTLDLDDLRNPPQASQNNDSGAQVTQG